MYLWKCWRDTRWFFLVFLVIAALPMPLLAFASHDASAVKAGGAFAFQNTFTMIVTAVAYALATICGIQEFTDKTAHFLFTKPRSRTYFVWVSWLVGFAELSSVAALNLLLGWGILAHYSVSAFVVATKGVSPGVSPRMFMQAMVYACFAYALTFAMTVILRSGLKGLGASLGLTVGAAGLVETLHWRWNIDLALPPQQIGHLPVALSESVWVVVALLFICVAQVVVERAEV